MKSILSFNHYDVLETVYKFNPSKEEGSIEITPSFKLDIQYNDEKRSEAALIFSVEIGDEGLEEYAFYVKAVIIGVFALEIDDSEQSNEHLINDLYKKNAVAILYPYMRSLVSDLSSKGSEMPLTLPPINVASMIEKHNLVTEQFKD